MMRRNPVDSGKIDHSTALGEFEVAPQDLKKKKR
jgi:hypothetical protein